MVLVVERDPHVRELQEYFLADAGYEVLFADTGEEALEKTRALRPDVLVTEVLVPKLDGLALTRAVRADEAVRDTKVVTLSFLAAADRAAEAGADAFLLKAALRRPTGRHRPAA